MTLNVVESFEIDKTIETDLNYIYDPEVERSVSLMEQSVKQNSALVDPKTNPLMDISYNKFEKKIFVSGVNYFRCFEMAGCQIFF